MLAARLLSNRIAHQAAVRPVLRPVIAARSVVNGASITRHAIARVNSAFLHTSRTVRKSEAAPADDNSMTVTVNGTDVSVPKGVTVLQACEAAGYDVPRFCYHDRLSIAGNCRMCLVEVEKAPKPVASCAAPAMPGMKVITDSPLVKKAREGVMEFLLANHPLDCPICDQGGECDLQDQSVTFGSDKSRFKEFKRSVEDKNIGPFVKTIMTRCIHCTRCVRFAAEVAGVEALGTTGRGNAMEIGTYVEQAFDSEVSGNVIDLCPVGALTSKPFAFTSRPWELISTESVDTMDAVGAAIRIDTRGAEIMRVVPRLNEDVNEEWLADRSRFSYDGLKRQRLDTPMVRNGAEFAPAEWDEAFESIHAALKGVDGAHIKAIAGDSVDAEALVAFKDLMNRLGSENVECRQDGAQVNADLRSNYVMNSGISGIEQADAIVLVGSNPRMEAPLVNTRIRKGVIHYNTPVAVIGPDCDLTYEHQHLSDDVAVLQQIADGKNAFCKTLETAENPMLIVGMGALRGGQSGELYATLDRIVAKYPNLVQEDWNGINFLQLAAARTAALDIGFVPGASASDEKAKVVFLLGADDFAEADIPKDAFVVYQGSHGDRGASRANVVLPGAAYTEKAGTYVNTEGRVQRTKVAVSRLPGAREDWKIVRALSEYLGLTLPYNTLGEVRQRLEDIAPHFAYADTVEPSSLRVSSPATKKKLRAGPIKPAIENHFMVDPITRNSRVMAKAVATLKTANNSYV
jgi:NADH dehydrogenase (ubiquinone) Fe-S protein 1